MTKKLMTHMVCAYPNMEESQKIFDILKEKSEYLEIQFPFSDPIADGPIIEKANEIALKN
jgi:tryptophan synthase alpha chain